MNFQVFKVDDSLTLFVKNIYIFTESKATQKTVLPFFADGFPGLMYQKTQNGLLVNPHKKEMPVMFLYGQTIKPIELVIDGRYELIIFQLYPFVLNSFFDIAASSINDYCYNLEHFADKRISKLMLQLNVEKSVRKRIKLISLFLEVVFKERCHLLDYKVNQAIQIMLAQKGQFKVSEVCKIIKVTERTFERRFAKATGISPRQFLKIIQFQQSYAQFTSKDYSRLTDIVYSNGYADQSHFIRVFKKFTGTTPLKQI